ncbi:MAG: hypothetical protein V4649_13650 [Bacteroidota bacterium]
MRITYRLNADELTVGVLDSIKAVFLDKAITITVEAEMDETEYLLASEANREHLERSMKQLERGEGISFTLEEFQKKYGNQ